MFEMDAALFATVGLRMYAAELSLCAPDAATCDYVTYHFALRWLSKSQSTGPKAGLNLIFYILYYGFIFCTLLIFIVFRLLDWLFILL